MKLTTGQSSGRAQWYDRNPTSLMDTYSATIAPAGITVRWTYTVPAARKAQVESAMAYSARATVATTAGVTVSNVRISPGGTGTGNIVRAGVTTNNQATDVDKMNAGNIGTLVATDVLDASTSDLSTGGTVAWNLSAKVTEYDA